MNDKFLIGVILGMVGGALVVTNSNKAKMLIQEGQQKVTEKMSEMTKKNKQEN